MHKAFHRTALGLSRVFLLGAAVFDALESREGPVWIVYGVEETERILSDGVDTSLVVGSLLLLLLLQ